MKNTPLRTCIVCKNKFPKKDLIRIVRDKKNSQILFDKTGKMNGRGAYVCTDKSCIDKLYNLKIISYALNVNTTKENMSDVKEEIKHYIENK